MVALPQQTKTLVLQQILLEKVVPSAILAPSAHNTQPWLFAVREDTLDAYIDASRHLVVSDPTKRQLYVSIGCAVTNALIAGNHGGYDAQLTYFPEGQDEEHKPAVRITFTPHPGQRSAPAAAALYEATQQRHTDRSFYDALPLTQPERAALGSKDDPAILLIEDRRQITAIAQLTEEATLATLSRQDFKEELSRWVRNNWTRQPDGMPGYAMGLPAPISLVGSFMVRIAPIHKQEGPKNRKQIESASAVAVFVTQTDTPADWMKAGQLLQRLWLEAVAADLAASPFAAAIEARGDIRSRLAQALQTDLFPQAILRLGHSAARNLRPTPRRSLQDCMRS